MHDIFNPAYFSTALESCKTQHDINVYLNNGLSQLNSNLLLVKKNFETRVSSLETDNATTKNTLNEYIAKTDNAITQVKGLQTAFNTQQANNASYQQSITELVTGFQTTLSSFTGSLAALNAANTSLSKDVLELKGLIDPTLLNSVIQSYQSIEATVQDKVNAAVEGRLNPAINTLRGELVAETTRAITAETGLSGRISALQTRQSEFDTTIDTYESNIRESLTAHKKSVCAALTDLETQLNNEEDRANSAEICLREKLEEEARVRDCRDKTLQANIDAEAKTRGDEDTSIREALATTNDNVATNGKAIGELNTKTTKLRTDLTTLEGRVTATEKDIADHEVIVTQVVKDVNTANDIAKATATGLTLLDTKVTTLDGKVDDEIAALDLKHLKLLGKRNHYASAEEALAGTTTFDGVTVSMTKTGVNYNLVVSVAEDVMFAGSANLSFTTATGTDTNATTQSNNIFRGRGSKTAISTFYVDARTAGIATIRMILFNGKAYLITYGYCKHDTATDVEFVVTVKGEGYDA